MAYTQEERAKFIELSEDLGDNIDELTALTDSELPNSSLLAFTGGNSPRWGKIPAGNVGGDYDVSKNFPTGGVGGTNRYTLSEAIAKVPSGLRAGGTTIKFVDSVSGKYVEWKLTAATWSSTVSDWQGVDEEPTAGSDNLVKSGGVYEFALVNSISNIKNYREIAGYIASASHFQHIPEGTVVYDNAGIYLFTNLIKLEPNTYRITTGCSTNAIAISEFDSNGNFTVSLYDGEGNTAKTYILSISETTYIRIVRHRDISIGIDVLHREFSYSENGNLFRYGYIASDTNSDGYSEGTFVGFDNEDVLYVFSNPMILTRGLYLIKSQGSENCNILSLCDKDGKYISCLIKGDGRSGFYYINIANTSYVILCGSRASSICIKPIDDIGYQVDGVVMHFGYIQTSGNIVSWDEPNPNYGNFYYIHSDLIVLEEGECIKANLKGSTSVSVISEWTWNNQFVRNIITGDNNEREYVYQATEKTYIKICSRSDTDVKFERTKEFSFLKNLGIVPITWIGGYIASDGTIADDAAVYKYSQIITLKEGFKYRISLKCSSGAIAVSKWVNGVYDSNIYYGNYSDRYHNFEITPAEDVDVRFCGREITDENTVLWYKSSYADPFAGKAINFLGDSYVANHNLPFSDSWEYKMCKEHYMTARNYGINGNGIVAGNNPMVSRYSSMNDDADYVIVIGGKNDYNNQLNLSDFKAGLVTLINGLINKYAQRGAKIGFLTPWRVYTKDSDDPQSIKLQQYVDAMVEVCNQYSVPIFDSSRKSSVFMFNQTFRTAYCQSSSDISHLNAAGHDYFLNKAENFIKSL